MTNPAAATPEPSPGTTDCACFSGDRPCEACRREAATAPDAVPVVCTHAVEFVERPGKLAYIGSEAAMEALVDEFPNLYRVRAVQFGATT